MKLEDYLEGIFLSKIEFAKEEKERMAQKVKLYFREELDQEIGGFDAEFLIDFFSEELGGVFYNKGLHDAQSIITTKVEEIDDAIYEIKKPVNI